MKQAGVAIAALALSGALSGCVVSISDNGTDRTEAVPPPPVPMVCDAAPAQSFAGRGATQSVGEAILEASGARSLRWGPPNSAWTMDYREDRVNVRYDAQMIITDITCG
jgi:hypothetical protein